MISGPVGERLARHLAAWMKEEIERGYSIDPAPSDTSHLLLRSKDGKTQDCVFFTRVTCGGIIEDTGSTHTLPRPLIDCAFTTIYWARGWLSERRWSLNMQAPTVVWRVIPELSEFRDPHLGLWKSYGRFALYDAAVFERVPGDVVNAA